MSVLNSTLLDLINSSSFKKENLVSPCVLSISISAEHENRDLHTYERKCTRKEKKKNVVVRLIINHH
jgi:hypothetical protein